ncbi:hypothetical protein [Isoptericola sediminis]|uniref:Protein kinase domain-containing protein n=1 Tax=Isoptericola sediminis TaxID=2733572 RepID=A0A849KBB2_9MICO|nr:hypothetical protein [Isoptericola sediminis]NNU28527.1 hypothetical protein [Isoptericola sediminis]
MQTDTVLAVPPDAAARDALLDRLRRLADIDAARVEPVGAAVARPDGALVVPRGAASATDLATVLAVRGRCDGPEAAGLAADLAQGLATLHSAGVVHGGLDVGDVVVDLNGRALLRPRLTPPHDADRASESEDVHALARLVETLCARAGSDTDTALRAVLAPALADDPRVRPEAGTLAARVHDELDPEPLRLPEPAALAAAALASGRQRPGTDPSDGEPRHRRARRPGEDGAGSAPVPGTRATRRSHPAGRARHRPASVWRPALAGAGVLVAVALLVGGGLAFTAAPGPGEDRGARAGLAAASTPSAAVAASAGPAPGAGTGAEQVTTDREDPAAAAAELTRRRAGLLAGEHDVAEVAVPGTPAHAADTAWLERARASGTRLVDARVTVLSVRLAGAPTPDRAEVVVRYVVEEHTQVGADGEVVTVPAGEPRTDTLRLAWTPDGWRVTDVV